MKPHFFLLLLLVVTACTDPTSNEVLPEIQREILDINEDEEVQELKENFLPKRATGARKLNILELADWSSVYKREDVSTGRIAYTLPFPMVSPTYYESLFIEITESSTQIRILRFVPTQPFTEGSLLDLASYSGEISWYSLEGELLHLGQYQDGEPVEQRTNTAGGRSEGCEYYYHYDVTEVCVAGSCRVTDMTFTHMTVECDDDNGGDIGNSSGGGNGGGGGSTVGIFRPVLPEQTYNLCPVPFTKSGSTYYAEVTDFFFSIERAGSNYNYLAATLETVCLGLPEFRFQSEEQASQALSEIHERARIKVLNEVGSVLTEIDTNEKLYDFFLSTLRMEFLGAYPGSTFREGHCLNGNIETTIADYFCN
ncbi:MAG TPA: hypothetical protein DCE41_26185 [Cytophagales bacterium]|nr:hypothetical protein [Cytophagales bacterium]HAA22426.1 hypothetical protein [Cytophagales bacterium]HAP62305.1 hypothetical protein [Cytophagales bacterium]